MINIKYGNITESNESTGKVKVDFIEDGITSDWIPVIFKHTKDDKESGLPIVGEHVAAIMDEHLDRGVVLGAIYSSKNTPGGEAASGVESKEFSDGTVVKYDKNTNEMSLDVVGDLVILCANASIIADTLISLDAPNVEISGDLQVDGAIVADLDIVGRNLIPASKVTLGVHVHPSNGQPPTPGT